jgi:hypothetical protein
MNINYRFLLNFWFYLLYLLNKIFKKAIVMGSKNTDPRLENLSEFSPSDIDKGFPAFMRVNPIIKWSYN